MTQPPQWQNSQWPYSQGQPAGYQGLPGAGQAQPGRSPGALRPSVLAVVVAMVVVLAACGVTVAALFGSGNVHPQAVPAQPPASSPGSGQPGISTSAPSSPPAADVHKARELAEQLAAGMSGDSAKALAAISCSTPSQQERAAFNTEAAKSDFTFTVIGKPHVNGDVATGKIQGRVKVLHYTLHKRQSGWCAAFDWSALL